MPLPDWLTRRAAAARAERLAQAEAWFGGYWVRACRWADRLAERRGW